jgi:addiction module HigA family antidote
MVMTINYEIVKGIHPGPLLERELAQRKISIEAFALRIHQPYDVIGDIVNAKRTLNAQLAFTIESVLGLQKGLLMKLQQFYDMRQLERAVSKMVHPDIHKFRPALFWDTKMEAIDWNKQKVAVIVRVFERGNFTEKKEVINFYGRRVIKTVLAKEKQMSAWGLEQKMISKIKMLPTKEKL